MSNTITAYFKGRIGVAEAVYQNDYGIVMAFDSIDLPAHFDCYFSRLNQEEALPGVGADNSVAIPNSILANSGNVTIHIPLHAGANDSEVEYIVYFKVIGRARPIDDGTPAQMTAIEQALALLQNPIGNIEQIVNEALAFTGQTFAEMKAELQEDFSDYKDDVDEDLADFKTEIRGDIADVEHDFDILDGQFQTAVAAITVDSEVQGIRTGDDGVTYTSAGEAVRTRFTDVKSDLNRAASFAIGKNLVNSAKLVSGFIQNDGTISTAGSYANYFTSELIEIESNTTYIFSIFNSSLEPIIGYTDRVAYLLYDTSRSPIGTSYTNIVQEPQTISSGSAKYIRISFYNTRYAQLEKGNTATAYEAYSKKAILAADIELDNKVVSYEEAFNSKVSMTKHASKNLIDPAELVTGKFIQDTGALVDSASYTTTGYIPISNGQSIVVTNARAGLLFTSAKVAITASYDNDSGTTTKVFTASADGYFRASLFASSASTAQAEYGSTPTPYTPYDNNDYFEDNVHLSDTMLDDVQKMLNTSGTEAMTVIISGNDMTVTEDAGGKILTRTYYLTGKDANVFNFKYAFLDGNTIKDCLDDITPQRLKIVANGSESQWTVGANHGWPCFAVGAGSLTNDDLGSVWTDGTRQYTLVTVSGGYAGFAYPTWKSDDDICITLVNPTSNLQHVSGATHTGNVSIADGAQSQFFPAKNNRTVKVFNGESEVVGDASFSSSIVRVVEHYDIIDYADLVAVMRANIGSTLDSLADSIDAVLSLDYVYEITPQTEVVYTTATALQDTKLKECGFMQASKINAVGGTIYRYANGVKDGTYFASSSLHNMTGYNTSIDIVSSDLIDSNKPTNRAVDLCIDSSSNILYGFTIGFVPDLSGGADSQRKANTRIWDMRNSGKMYPICYINKDLSRGESVTVVGYRHYIVPQNITNKSIVPLGNKEYCFIDAHAPVSDNVRIGDYGNKVDILDSDNMNVADAVGAIGVPFYASASYSVAVIKTDK